MAYRWLFAVLIFLIGRDSHANTNFCGANRAIYDASTSLTSGQKPADWATYVSGTAYMAYQNQFTFPNGTSALPSQASVNSVVDAASGYDILVIDIESYPFGKDQSEATNQATAGKWKQIMDWVHERNQNMRVCQYGFPNGSVDQSDASTQSANETIMTVLSSTPDYLCPNAYILTTDDSPYSDTRTWLTNLMAECDSLYHGKCAPISWDMYQDNIGGYVPGRTPMDANITAISAGNPAQVTLDAAVATRTGDYVVLEGMTGAGEIEGVKKRVTKVDATHFTLDGVDGAAITAWSSGGFMLAALPQGLWRMKLDILAEYTDTILFWHAGPPYHGVLQSTDPFYYATKDFINSASNICVPDGYTLKPKRRH